MAAESAEQRGRAVALPRVDMRLLAGLALVAVIEPHDLALAEARLEGPLAALALPEAELGAAVGRTATGAIHAGELVVRPDLGSGPVIGPGELAVPFRLKEGHCESPATPPTAPLASRSPPRHPQMCRPPRYA